MNLDLAGAEENTEEVVKSEHGLDLALKISFRGTLQHGRGAIRHIELIEVDAHGARILLNTAATSACVAGLLALEAEAFSAHSKMDSVYRKNRQSRPKQILNILTCIEHYFCNVAEQVSLGGS